MTPAGIVECAIAKGIALISITDHNRIGNVEEALLCAEGQGILVVPGVELTTIQGHLLVYFETLEQLTRFYGKLDFNQDRTMCSKAITDCLDLAKEYEGFGIAAHIDRDCGFETQMVHYNPAKKAIVTHPTLLAIEVANSENLNWFSHNDSHEGRRSCFQARLKALQAHSDYCWPTVMFSDAHTMAALSGAAEGSQITRLKMDQLSFSALRIALMDASSRVKTEETIPKRIPRFIGMRTEGGFLGTQTIHFNRNLNCIIGGRGTGKSTLLESLRVASGNGSSSSLVDSEAWLDLIRIVYEDETGQQHLLERRKGEAEVKSLLAVAAPLTRVPIESYGQGETASRIQGCTEDPSVLLEFLDNFIDTGVLAEQDEALREQLASNRRAMSEVKKRLANLPRVVELFNDAQRKVETLKTEKVGELVSLEQSLSEGRKFRADVVEKLGELVTTVRRALQDRQLMENLLALEATSLVVGKCQLERIKKIIEIINENLDEVEQSWTEKSNIHIERLKAEIEDWKAQETKLEEKIESKRRELQAKGIELDAKFIRKLTGDLANYRGKLTELKADQARLKELKKERAELVKQRRGCKAQISSTRTAWARRISEELRAAVSDYEISVKFRSGRLSRDAAELIKDQMEWRTRQVPRAQLITEQYSPFELLDIGKNGDSNALAEIKGVDGDQVLSKSDIQSLLRILKEPEVIEQLEAVCYEDLPEISVAKRFEQPNGEIRVVTRGFSRLSLGQQQAVLLSILMFSKSMSPLIIDQPEDNLDNEFIYRTIVGNLKRVKEKRQVIIVTHNANIAVLGDSELILPLKATSERAHVMDRGSIDCESTRRVTCEILEGSEEAFRRRQQIYQLGSE